MVSKQEAYNILEVKPGATPKEIERKYKELSLKWHPQKHKYSALSNQKFKEISRSYVALTKPKEKKQDDMSMMEMLGLFEKTFFGDEDVLSRNDLDSSDDFLEVDDDDDEDDDDDDDDDIYDSDFSYPDVIRSSNLSKIVGVLVSKAKCEKESAEKAERNADELIAEEEKEKQKAAKRKAKKKRRKLKKKQEKDSGEKAKSEEDGKVSPVRLNDSNVSASAAVEEEGLDPTSAFVAVAVSKSKVAALLQNKKEVKQSSAEANEGSVSEVNPQVLQSRELAIRGNMMANIGEYNSALGLFTDAIKLNPTEFKYFCNRSYCYHQLSMFDRALKDAEKAIALQPTWPKGYFRKGQAQAGLKKYADAETCFRKVLSLDKNCKEAIQEVKNTQIFQLMEMGFNRQQSEQALEEHVNLQEASEALMGGAYPGHVAKCTTNGLSQAKPTQSMDDEIYMSDEDEEADWFIPVRPLQCQTSRVKSSGASASGAAMHRTVSQQVPASSKSQPAVATKEAPSNMKIDPRNPEGKTSLWVGNVKAQVTEKMLSHIFSKYGEIGSIRVLPDRRCAFINYKDKNAAEKAMDSLQGYECCGEHFLIRFPDKSHTLGQPLIMKKNPGDKTEVKEKIKGPVAGDECFFWRTTGCHYGNNCFYRHIKENKGIDNKFK